MDEKPVNWLGSSYDDLMDMPERVQDTFGYALDLAQRGKRHRKAKPFKVKGEPGLTEIVEDNDGDTYRAIYTVRYEDSIYVVHCFQKKSTIGIKTSKQDVDIVIERLKRLREILSKR
ncbi:MAG: type II toxin-antitoxin system RelE/ParE family toxin [Desulfovibrio fairfieldensis]|nr:type II toxin-antitoxin system RelE/ParE family toxin [Desulfovibrio fairfieldensis]